MTFDPLLQDWRPHLERLVLAAEDVVASPGDAHAAGTKYRGAAAHEAAFEEYLPPLRAAVAEAMAWWSGRKSVGRKSSPDADEESLVKALWRTTPAGPADAPSVVQVVRDFWLRCAEINASVPPEKFVPPAVFLLRWLADRREEELLRVLVRMPYWPIGLDAEGRWV